MSYSCKSLGDAECDGCECFGLLHWITKSIDEREESVNKMPHQRDSKGNWNPKPFYKRRKLSRRL